MKQINRRTFLKLAGTSAAAAALYQSTGSIMAALNVIDREAPPSEEKWIPSVCQLCPAECGLRVRVVGDVAVKIKGNRQNPGNQGRTCPKGQVGLHLLYNPDRVRTPLMRVGKRGEGRWQPISWDDGIEAVATWLEALRVAGTPERAAFLYDRPVGMLGDAIFHFCQAMGTPNTIDVRSNVLSQAVYLTQGWAARPGYNLERTRYLLNFNYALLESAQPSVRLLNAYAFMRRGRPDERTHIVQIEPRLSVTGIKADEWIPIKPGTEGLLALGIAWVILYEHLYDYDFVEQHSYGFEEWREAVLQNYSPERVAPLTDVSVRTIERLAREFADTPPALALGGEAVGQHTNGLLNHMAIHSLNALVGSIDVPGGVMMQRQPPLTPWPDVHLTNNVTTQGLTQPRIDRPERYPLQPVVQRHDHSVVHHLAKAILYSDPYPLEALLLYRANPIHDSPDPGAWLKALDRVPLIVSFDSFIEETSAYADYILPDHTFLERWIAAPLLPSMGYPVLALGQPVVEPLHETRALGDVLIQLAHQIGGVVEESFPWKDYVELLRFRISDMFTLGRGSIQANTIDEFWDELAERGTWFNTPYHFAGGERNPENWETVLATPSGKFEFTPQLLQGQASLSPPYYELPRYVGEEDKYPLYLQLYTLMAQASGPGAGNLPHLHELYGLHIKRMWGNWVEINPETAHELDIKDWDEVWVESLVGRIRLPARLYPGIRPEVVGIPTGLGHTVGGRWTVGIGSNPETLVSNDHVDKLNGAIARQSVRVKVYKAEG